jgi:hypothetical protein
LGVHENFVKSSHGSVESSNSMSHTV